ncbi:M56 family metallopeptidase [Mangrovimicrobium sediminis]|uniref:M56 family metallopeptidase n=1 Tax=Mangrovimicrobium sediminis TaxID=2562682 RepID=A0A4Z0LY15_9GAMM|nr:M56 family metallopeptidase [Haliea sp. SAOS-164]TGD72124.1 M56 family metallopeptidase [Haliea sp. SAOS-164]
MIEAATEFLAFPRPEAGTLFALLAKGTLVSWCGLFICSELALMAAAVRHRIALGALVCLAALPVLGLLVAPWALEVLPREGVAGLSWFAPMASLLVSLYLAVAGFMIVRLARDVAALALLGRRARRTGEVLSAGTGRDARRAVEVIISGEVSSPMTWGWLRPQVLLPPGARSWDCADLAMVIRHEQAHIDRADWLWHLWARCVHALYWPVPGIRQVLRQLSLSAEQACDDHVLATGVAPSRYAAMLLRLARGNSLPATVSLGRESELGVRVRYMVEEIADHSVFSTGAIVIGLLGLVLTTPLAAMHLGSRPDIPVLPLNAWGAVDLEPPAAAPLQRIEHRPLYESAKTALRPSPQRPARPVAAEYPPESAANNTNERNER